MKLYHLIDERDGDVCYVGITDRSLDTRLQNHKKLGSNEGYQKAAWCTNHPVKIVLVKYQLGLGIPTEKKEIARILRSGKMLFNKSSLPRMTKPEKATFIFLQREWIHQRRVGEVDQELKDRIYRFLDRLKHLKS